MLAAVSPWAKPTSWPASAVPARACLLGDRGGDRGCDLAVEHRGDDVVLAQLLLGDDRRDRAARPPSSSPR